MTQGKLPPTSARDELKQALKRMFGAPSEPSFEQLTSIIDDIATSVRSGRKPTQVDWEAVVSRHYPAAGPTTGAFDDSDLYRLIREILSQGKTP